MRSYRIALGLAMGALLLAPAARAEEGAPTRPRYQDLRQDENWSVLRGASGAAARDFFDPVKYIPLTGSGSAWLSFGAQLRERIEFWNNFGFGAPVGQGHDDVFLLSRVLFHADLHATEWLRIFAQGKSAFVTDRDLPGGARKLDVDQVDLQNGFLELELPQLAGVGVMLRGGRQELLFGAQRLVSPLDWANTRRTFDGGTATFSFGEHWQATGFFTRPVRVNRYDLDDWGNDDDFYGIYATGQLFEGDLKTDLYWLGLERDDVTVNGTSGDMHRHTLGARMFGVVPGTPLDLEVEGAYQLGDVGSADIRAYMVAAQLGWWLDQLRMSPRFFAGFDWASGDDQPGGDVETFDQLYPLSHQYYGFIDALARQNAVDASYGVNFRPLPATTASLTAHHFWLADDDDALYNAGGAVDRPPSGGSSNWLGIELDLLVRHQLDIHTAIVAGYSHFFAAGFLDATGRGRDIDFGYLIFQYTF
jgi:hypothetical protein